VAEPLRPDLPTAYVFGTSQPSDDAWEVWDALMQDAEDRGEGRAMCRQVVAVQVKWRPQPKDQSHD
jgi:alpha-D-ribose 1-methylphosphonate 5-triphosphate synthase subunit PhnG